MAQIITPYKGPKAKAPNNTNTAEKSSFKNDAVGKIENSKKDNKYASAEKMPVPAIHFTKE